MSEVRVLVQGMTNDPDAFRAFMSSESTYIQETEPGTVQMEIFVDPSTGAVVVHERYSDADAFMTHSLALMESDRLQRFTELFDVKRMTFLSPIEDERVATVARQFRATQASPIAGFAR